MHPRFKDRELKKDGVRKKVVPDDRSNIYTAQRIVYIYIHFQNLDMNEEFTTVSITDTGQRGMEGKYLS